MKELCFYVVNVMIKIYNAWLVKELYIFCSKDLGAFFSKMFRRLGSVNSYDDYVRNH